MVMHGGASRSQAEDRPGTTPAPTGNGSEFCLQPRGAGERPRTPGRMAAPPTPRQTAAQGDAEQRTRHAGPGLLTRGNWLRLGCLISRLRKPTPQLTLCWFRLRPAFRGSLLNVDGHAAHTLSKMFPGVTPSEGPWIWSHRGQSPLGPAEQARCVVSVRGVWSHPPLLLTGWAGTRPERQVSWPRF